MTNQIDRISYLKYPYFKVVKKTDLSNIFKEGLKPSTESKETTIEGLGTFYSTPGYVYLFKNVPGKLRDIALQISNEETIIFIKKEPKDTERDLDQILYMVEIFGESISPEDIDKVTDKEWDENFNAAYRTPSSILPNDIVR